MEKRWRGGEGGEEEGRGWEKESRRFEGSVYTHMLMIQQRVYAGCGSHLKLHWL